MKTSSAKAKGRKLQQQVRNDLRILLAPYGIVNEDIESRGMGQNGEDLILSPAAKKLLDLSIECKNVEKLNVPTTFLEHYNKYKDKEALKLLIHSKNRSGTLVTLRWDDLWNLLADTLGLPPQGKNGT